MENNTLQHHGILGMKWGVRRFQNRDGSLTSAGKKRRADDSDTDENKQKQPQKKTVKTMSDDELREKISRLQLEKQYTALMNETNPPKSHKGRDFVLDVLKKSGENLLPQVLNHYGAKYLNIGIGEKESKTVKKKNPQTGEEYDEVIEVVKEVIFSNNKKK